MTRFHNVARIILEVLERSEPYALPEPQLLLEINAALRPPSGQAEFDEVMLHLNSHRAIATVPDPLDPELVKWTITEAGKAMKRQ